MRSYVTDSLSLYLQGDLRPAAPGGAGNQGVPEAKKNTEHIPEKTAKTHQSGDGQDPCRF